MLSRDVLRIAVPSKGRLHEPSLSLLRRAGLSFRVAGRRLFSVCNDSVYECDGRIIRKRIQDRKRHICRDKPLIHNDIAGLQICQSLQDLANRYVIF